MCPKLSGGGPATGQSRKLTEPIGPICALNFLGEALLLAIPESYTIC